ncbi:MAG: ABC transporter permease [Chloroflexi bacterium]|nr:ABC transporter permease [Chloroflexota bacterium]
MSPDRALAISERLVRQVLRDHRTLALMLAAPSVVMALVGFSFADQPAILDYAAPALLTVFGFFFTFVLTGVSFLRERAQGTLDRLLATPVGRGDILVGYLLGFLLFAAVQASVILALTLVVLGVSHQGALWEIFAFLMVVVVMGVNLGIFISVFARNEFQVVQFIPLVFAPQVFLSGILLPVEQMPGFLQAVANVLPLKYAVEGMREIMLQGKGLSGVTSELAVLAGFAVVLLALASVTVRRS